jgi:hypothetical protein
LLSHKHPPENMFDLMTHSALYRLSAPGRNKYHHSLFFGHPFLEPRGSNYNATISYSLNIS